MSKMAPDKSLAAEIEAVKAIRKVLCRRVREAAPGVFSGPLCDGAVVVCGWCDRTARLQLIALAEREKGDA